MSSATAASHNATLWLIIWMLNNIGVTLLNKAAFATVHFHYPYFLSAIHMICNACGAHYMMWAAASSRSSSSTSAAGSTTSPLKMKNPPPENEGDEKEALLLEMEKGHADSNHNSQANSTADIVSAAATHPPSTTTSWAVQWLGPIQRQPLDAPAQRMMLAFSVIFSLNIAIGNVSLKYVSVNFNQVMRSLVPAMTMMMELGLGKVISPRRQGAVLPIVLGVAMACFGDMSYTALGFFYTVLCVLLAALKVVASGYMLTGPSLALHPVDLLGHMAPLALIQCMALALVTGEISAIAARWDVDLSPFIDPYPMLVVWMSGFLSFSLNICSLQANKLTSPLTLCIAANVKQVLMIAAGTLLFGTLITPLNGAGIIVVLLGSARYSYISVLEKSQGGYKKKVVASSSSSHATPVPPEEEADSVATRQSSSSGGGRVAARHVTPQPSSEMAPLRR